MPSTTITTTRKTRKLARRTRPKWRKGANVPLAKSYRFKRTYAASVSTVAGVSNLGVVFSLANLPGVAEFQALFDQYRIRQVDIAFIWRSSSISMIETGANNVAGMPIMYSVVDRDDAANPATINEMLEYGTCQKTYFSTVKRSKTFRILPTVLNTVYRTGVTSAYTVGRRSQWLDMAVIDVPHYGFKWYIDVPQGGGVAVDATFDINYTMHFECKTTR